MPLVRASREYTSVVASGVTDTVLVGVVHDQ